MNERAAWLRGLWVAIGVTACGALAGVAWQALWDAPSGITYKGEWFLDPAGPDVALSGTALYVLVALVVGVVLGVGVALLPGYETATFVGMVAGSTLAAWVMYAVGHALGPEDPHLLAAGLPDLTSLPAELLVAAPDDSRNPLRSTALLSLPVGSLTGMAVVYLLGRRRAGSHAAMSATGIEPEHLDTTADNRKRLFVLGGVLATVAVVGGTAWAATSFFATGVQPSDALPASTIAYASVDLDPSGSQKIEAIRTLRKFPAFVENVDLDTDDDLRERLFAEVTETGECEGLDYERDVAPWLGSRAAIAAVDAGEENPSPVGVIQVTDADKAEDGMANLIRTCGGDETTAGSSTGGWIVDGDWVVVAENRDIAQHVVDQTEKGTLADDDDFKRWTGEAGDAGILSFYAAQEAAAYFGDVASAGGGMFGLAPPSFGAPEDSSDSMVDAIEDFEGMAMTVRFDGGALEIESATSANQDMQKFFASSVGVDLVSSLPDDTVAALGLGLEDGWVDAMAEQMVKSEGGDATVEELYEEGSSATGLELPDDLEKLFGDGLVVALGDGIDPDAVANGGPLELPLGVKIRGDADDIQSVLDKLAPQLGPDERGMLETAAADGYVAIGPDDDFREELAQDGSLGDNEVFEQVVEGADDAQAVLFVNFNADDDWLVRIADDMDPEFASNLAPLAAFGVSGWFDDGVGHALVKLTTD